MWWKTSSRGQGRNIPKANFNLSSLTENWEKLSEQRCLIVTLLLQEICISFCQVQSDYTLAILMVVAHLVGVFVALVQCLDDRDTVLYIIMRCVLCCWMRVQKMCMFSVSFPSLLSAYLMDGDCILLLIIAETIQSNHLVCFDMVSVSAVLDQYGRLPW